MAAEQLDSRKLLLLKTALRLFAAQGVEAVPLRLINREAGFKNNSALHYHFGSKEGLLEALARFVQDRFEELREQALSEVEAAKSVSVRDIFGAFIAPYISIMETEDWGYDAVRFVARMEFERDETVHRILNKYAEPSLKRFKKLLVKALSDIPRKVLHQRFNFCISSIVLGLAAHKSLRHSYLGDMTASLEQLGHLYADVCALGLGAPV